MRRHKITLLWFWQFENCCNEPEAKNPQVTETVRWTYIDHNLKKKKQHLSAQTPKAHCGY